MSMITLRSIPQKIMIAKTKVTVASVSILKMYAWFADRHPILMATTELHDPNNL